MAYINGNKILFGARVDQYIIESLAELGIEVTVAELNHLKGVRANLQTQLDNKAPDYSVQIYNGNGGVNAVKFLTVDYSTCGSESGVAVKLGMVSGHGNGTAYAFLQDVIIKVNYLGEVEVNTFKYYNSEITYSYTHSFTGRMYGDIFYVADTTNKIVDFYCVVGQYARLNMTPPKRVTYSYGGVITQYSQAVLYSSGEMMWGNNDMIAMASDIPATTKTLKFTFDDGTTEELEVYTK